MLQEVKDTTKSSPSATSKRSKTETKGLETPVQFVKGVGPRLAAKLAHRDILTVRDLLTFFPRAYEDRSKFTSVSDAAEGERATLSVRVTGSRRIPLRRRPKPMLEIRCTDDTGQIKLKWFNYPRGMDARFKPGTQIIVTGHIKGYMGQAEIIHPEVSFGGSGSGSGSESSEDSEYNAGRIIPVYTEIEGIPTRSLRKILWHALEKYGPDITEDLPRELLDRHGLPSLREAIEWIHFPPSDTDSAEMIEKITRFRTPAHLRLIYEEFFKFEFLILRRRLNAQSEKAVSFEGGDFEAAIEDLRKALPFELTAGQAQAMESVLRDLKLPYPMNRLVQGDVGAGKTAVAFLCAGGILGMGGQAALMAPTEVLADQHYRNAVKLFGGRLRVGLLTGRTTAKEREKLIARLSGGEPMLLIGTHALIEDPVKFARLDLVMIDEQHRFGVEQRRRLRAKGERPDAEGDQLHPHHIVLSATPIPRTLALTAYGELAVSSIRELPPGRSPIVTKVARGKARTGAYDTIRAELRAGRQAFFIYPLVNDSEAEGFTSLRSAVAESERLDREVFPEFNVGLLHGQIRPDEKAAVMDGFRKGEIHVLVSTTVVEVGVDVPNATVMAVEHSERFGLSQLHQLRGRVGRGKHQSYCFLFTADKIGETGSARLEVLERTTDGFEIAEADLEIRGPGEFLGTRQAGALPFRMANLVRDKDLLLKARNDVIDLLKADPELAAAPNSMLRTYLAREGEDQSERLRTG